MEIQNEGPTEPVSTIVYEKQPDIVPELELEPAKEPAKRITNLDICFMLDCTGSMQSYIDRSRNKIKDIIEEVKQQYPESEIQVGIVGYRDISDTKRFEILPFTSDIHSAKKFLDAILADGGGDTPEDVNGAFQQTLGKMEWQGQAKMIVHIADAPCHGKKFHTSWSENYPDGYKDDVDWEVLFKQIIDNHIDYLFLKIEAETDMMFTKFKEIAEKLGATEKGVLFKQEPISNTDAAAKTATTTFAATPFVPYVPLVPREKKKRGPRKEKEPKKPKKERAPRSESRSRSAKKEKKPKKEKKVAHKEESEAEELEVEESKSTEPWVEPTHWTRSQYRAWLEHGGKELKKDGYWTIPQIDESLLEHGVKKSVRKSVRKPSVSKDKSEKRGRKSSIKGKRSTTKDKERSEEKKKSVTKGKGKGAMALENPLPKRAFIAPKGKMTDKSGAPVVFPAGMSALDEQEYFAKMLAKEMKESIHRKKDVM